MFDGIGDLAIQSVSARPRGIGTEGGSHNRQNSWSHAMSHGGRRILRTADSP